MNKLFLIVPVILISIALCTFADDISFTFHEHGKITSYYDDYYIYSINGNLSIYNPNNVSIYSFTVPIYQTTLDFKALNSSKATIEDGHIAVDGLAPQETITIPYRVLGISKVNLASNNKSVMYNAVTYFTPRLYSSLMGTLKKGPLEDVNITRHHARVITVRFDNPTTFNYNIEKVKIIKTPSMDPSQQLAVWEFPKDSEVTSEHSKTMLKGNEHWIIDFKDNNASEGEVYWLSTNIYLDSLVFLQAHNNSYFDVSDLFIPYNDTNITENLSGVTSFLENRIFIRKYSSHSLVNPYDIVNISLIINNLEPHSINVLVKDIIPDVFDIVGVPKGATVIKEDGKDVLVMNTTISYGENRRINYQIQYTDIESIGREFFPSAQLHYKNDVVYSQRIAFVKQFVPEKRIFVQKKLKYLSGEDVEVTLMVQNLGESKVSDLVLKEFLSPKDEFKEITKKVVRKGVWEIDEINQGDVWEVKYVTQRSAPLNSLPELLGVPHESVLKTIILNNEVKSSIFYSATDVIEYLGLTVVVITGLLMLLFQFKPKKKHYASRSKVQDLKIIGSEIHRLKENTKSYETDNKRHSAKTQHTTSDNRSVHNSHKSLDDSFKSLKESKEMLDKLKK